MNLSAPVGHLDSPAPDSVQDPLCLRVQGWVFAGNNEAAFAGVEIRVEGLPLGQTTWRYLRPDVNRVLKLSSTLPTGFELFLNAPSLLGKGSVSLEAHLIQNDGTTQLFATSTIRLLAHDHRSNHYGTLLDPSLNRVFHRDDIYGSGPSAPEADADCLALVRRHLAPPPSRVLDVGCGIGAYGIPLRQDGYDWFGVEVKASDAEALARRGLPHRLIDVGPLPFADAEFDETICIEVLEHIPDPDVFLQEIRRVTRHQLLVSVPNLELLPYLQRHACVPWHLLEADHKNFFTRANLHHLLSRHFSHVEVGCYGQHPLPGPEGLPLFYHLFARATV